MKFRKIWDIASLDKIIEKPLTLCEYINMQKNISTNIQIPEPLWKAVKIKAAKEGKTMKDIVVEGLNLIINKQIAGEKPLREKSARDLMLEFSGCISTGITDGSVNHDRTIYDEELDEELHGKT